MCFLGNTTDHMVLERDPQSKSIQLSFQADLVSVNYYYFLFLFNYSHPHFPPLLFLALPTLHLPHSILPTHTHGLCPWVLYICSLTYTLSFFLPLLPSPLLSTYCQFILFPCLWFYFAHLFVLLFSFHL